MTPARGLHQRALARGFRLAAAALRLATQCVLEAHVGEKQALEHAGRLYNANMMAAEDAVAGLTAFLQKRQPVWRHK